jgi:putative PIN family toxin of toxin-antitoxin system
VIIVLDTNVLVSGIISPHGPPGRIVDLLRAGEIRLVMDDRIRDEYADVLRRPQLAPYFGGADVEHILEYVNGNSERVTPTTVIADLPDADDAPLLETALTAGAILVTGNRTHYLFRKRHGVTVETPAEFIQRFAAG